MIASGYFEIQPPVKDSDAVFDRRVTNADFLEKYYVTD
jgi:hypothetical protein